MTGLEFENPWMLWGTLLAAGLGLLVSLGDQASSMATRVRARVWKRKVGA
jgi:hypothetical protein